MSKLNKLFAALLLLVLLPARQYAQQTIKENVIDLDVSLIENPDLRYLTLYYIANDNNLEYVVSEQETILVTTSNDWSGEQLKSYYDDLMASRDADFAEYTQADKETQGEMFSTWKETLPQDLFVLLFKQMLSETSKDGNQLCANSEPFCTSDIITFHVEANPGGQCESGPTYGCLQPYIARPPFWFHMRIANPGAFTIIMSNSANVDIDYCCWGPFDDPVTPCPGQLTNIVDCGSTAAATEYCNIPSNAQAGKYYIMVITKYNQSTPTNISFQKQADSGPGTTDCSILPPLATTSTPEVCVGEDIHFTADANGNTGASFSWTGPGNWTSTQQNPTRPNAQMSYAGSYYCTITVGTQTSDPVEVPISVYAMPVASFNAPSGCAGSPIQFVSTSTTNPGGQNITSYRWNFGDGTSGNGASVSHTYTSGGNYTVSLAVTTNGDCEDQATRQVSINHTPTANASAMPSNVGWHGTATLTATQSPGNVTYSWTPADKVVSPNERVTETVPLEQTTTFTLTVTSNDGCGTATKNVTVTLDGNAMSASAYADEIESCREADPTTGEIIEGVDIKLHASASGGVGGYTYNWSGPNGWTSTEPNPTYQGLKESCTFSCTITDGDGSAHYDYDIPINIYPEYSDIQLNVERCFGQTYEFDGVTYGQDVDVTGYFKTIHNCDSIVNLHLRVSDQAEFTNSNVTTCDEDYVWHYGQDNQYDTLITASGTYVKEIFNGECMEKWILDNFIRYNLATGDTIGESPIVRQIKGCNLVTIPWDEYSDQQSGDIHEETLTNETNVPIIVNDYKKDVLTKHGCVKTVSVHAEIYPSFSGQHCQLYEACVPFYFENNILDSRLGRFDTLMLRGMGIDTLFPGGMGNGRVTDDIHFGYMPAGQETIEKNNLTINYDNKYGCASTFIIDKLTIYDTISAPNIMGISEIDMDDEYFTGLYSYKIDSALIQGGGKGYGHDVTYHWHLAHNADNPGPVPGWKDWDVKGQETDSPIVVIDEEGWNWLICDISTDLATARRWKLIYTTKYKGFDENTMQNISIRPNPTKGMFYVDFGNVIIDSPVTIKVTDNKGMMLQSLTTMPTEGSSIEMTLQSCSKGLYFVQITGRNINTVRKLIVN